MLQWHNRTEPQITNSSTETKPTLEQMRRMWANTTFFRQRTKIIVSYLYNFELFIYFILFVFPIYIFTYSSLHSWKCVFYWMVIWNPFEALISLWDVSFVCTRYTLLVSILLTSYKNKVSCMFYEPLKKTCNLVCNVYALRKRWLCFQAVPGKTQPVSGKRRKSTYAISIIIIIIIIIMIITTMPFVVLPQE